jgi:hypothetical protein
LQSIRQSLGNSLARTFAGNAIYHANQIADLNETAQFSDNRGRGEEGNVAAAHRTMRWGTADLYALVLKYARSDPGAFLITDQHTQKVVIALGCSLGNSDQNLVQIIAVNWVDFGRDLIPYHRI